jgi:hypothetical protein
MYVASGGDLGYRKLGLLVDSEIVLSLDTVRPGCSSTRPYQQRPLINKTVSTETSDQQGLIVGKLGQGMRCCKCNSTSNVFVCESRRKVYVWVRQ